jgi:ATP-dependent RNA helicase DDX24/MAK5
MAYGLPIIQHVLSNRTAVIPSEPEESGRRDLKALILAPTRELALQVVDHLRAVVPQTKLSPSGSRSPPPVSVAAVVGGMSSHKQKRILERGVDILVATPGRLWDIIQEVSMISRFPTQMRARRFHHRRRTIVLHFKLEDFDF